MNLSSTLQNVIQLLTILNTRGRRSSRSTERGTTQFEFTGPNQILEIILCIIIY